MTISKDLFLSILAMDAYNREYGAGIELTGDQIGVATILRRESVGIDAAKYQDWQAAGFYAVAYTVGEGVQGLDAGTTVISYRGTRRRDARSAGRPFGHATAARAQSGMCRNMMQPCGRRIG